ncbi:MAG: glycosyltransferase [Helicobacteraceae bacterium]|nr:glycosyltransferase [Helicobacteraceae bacterium]
MNIFFLTNDARNTAGGAFFSQKALIEELNRQGHKAAMIATKERGGEKEQGFEVIFLKRALFSDLGRALQLAKLLRERKADLLVANMNPQIFLAALLTFLPFQRYKKIGIFRMVYYIGYRSTFIKKIIGALFGRLDALVAISDYAANVCQKTFYLKQKPAVIYNAFDIEDIKRKAAESIQERFENAIVNVGRLVDIKRQHHMIDLAEDLLRAGVAFKVIIIGEGRKREDLERAVRERKLEEHVLLLGRIDNPFPYIKAAKLLIVTSESEGFGRVVLEAFALRVPVAAFCSNGGSGHIELLEGGRGFLVEDQNRTALCETVSRILDDDPSVQDAVENAYNFALTLTPKAQVDKLLRSIGGF